MGFRDFRDLEPGRRALDRSEAGRQVPREDFDRFPMDFHYPRQQNPQILLKFIESKNSFLFLQYEKMLEFVEKIQNPPHNPNHLLQAIPKKNLGQAIQRGGAAYIFCGS